MQKQVLLMDCQGTADNRHSTPELDRTILFIGGAKLASVQIVNVKSKLTSNDLTELEVLWCNPLNQQRINNYMFLYLALCKQKPCCLSQTRQGIESKLC